LQTSAISGAIKNDNINGVKMALGSGKDYGMTTKGRWANQLLEK
jgi:Tfp pilus assembly pilus retraction ATPase PilT